MSTAGMLIYKDISGTLGPHVKGNLPYGSLNGACELMITAKGGPAKNALSLEHMTTLSPALRNSFARARPTPVQGSVQSRVCNGAK